MCAMKVDVAWSPSEANKFITVSTDIQLYEVEELKEGFTKPSAIPISEYTCANLINSSSDHQYLKCYSWYPKIDHPLLLAVGMANGRVVLESLDPIGSRDAEISGRELIPKQSRPCNCVAWNPVEANILVSCLDKNRTDNSILIWDISRSSYLSSAIEATPFERRSMFAIDSPTNTKPLLELGLGESTQSVHWFPNNPKLFVCGMSYKHLRLFDTRDVSKHQEMTTSKAVYNLCIDPAVEHRFASSVDNCFVLWDVRNFEKPVATINESKQIVKLCWSPIRSGLLAVLCKDSSTINLYDIQSPAGNDEVEPAIVERNLHPYASHSIMSSFSWHPTQENRMLTISQNNQLLDYTIFDRITLNWSPTSEIVWTYGRKILQCVDSSDEFYSCLDDISVKMRKRACQGYGLKKQLYMNAELADDPSLSGVWMWLDLVKSFEDEYSRRSGFRYQPKYEGVHSIVFGESGTNIVGLSEPCHVTWIGINSPECKIVKYTSEEREKALRLCGWGADFDSTTFTKRLERIVSEGQYTRASAIAVFNLEIRRAIKILSKGAVSQSHKGSVDLNAIAMALAGYTEDKSALWREISSSLKAQLTDPHLRAIFAFLTAENENYEEILNESKIAVQDRLAFACLYLNDRKLSEFLDGLKTKMAETGNVDGILLTGLTNDGLSLIQRYVDTTGDLQTASLIILHTLPSQACEDPRARAWVQSYRNLLDTWMLWKQRALFDVRWYNSNPYTCKPAQQIFVSCNFCRRPVSQHIQYRQPMPRFSQPAAAVAAANAAAVNRKINCCPGCRKPLPRCSLCLSHMGTPAGVHWQRQNNTERKKITDFSNWLTWCQTCRHGGHSIHILGWFQHHTECPVTGCTCKCMSLDKVGNLASVMNS